MEPGPAHVCSVKIQSSDKLTLSVIITIIVISSLYKHLHSTEAVQVIISTCPLVGGSLGKLKVLVLSLALQPSQVQLYVMG